MKAIVMPQFGETMEEEIVIVQWLKNVGDEVQEGEALLEIETDKASLSVEAVDSGRLVTIAKIAGEAAKPGSIIGYLAE